MQKDQNKGGTIRTEFGTISFLFFIFFLNMLSRLGLAPFLPGIENELSLSHTEAGAVFLFVSLGYGSGLFSSTFISSRLYYHQIIVLSSFAVGMSLLIFSFSKDMWTMRFTLYVLGLAGGLYLPNGVALLTSLVRPEDWGKTLSLHQLAPNMAYICSPFLASVILSRYSWRFAVSAYAVASIAAGLIFFVFGRTSKFRSEPISLGVLGDLIRMPAIWIMIFLFSLSLAVNQGVFSIMPLYLTAERQIDQALANHMISLSRLVAFAMPLITGWISDRYGLKRTLYATVTASAIATLILVMISGTWLVAGLILQATASVCFFPLGFAVLSRITSSRTRNIAVAFTVPFGHFFGAGLVPTLIGVAGDAGSFKWGIGTLGALTFLGLWLLKLIKLDRK